METAKNFHSQGNFLADEIQIRMGRLINRSDHSCARPRSGIRICLASLWILLFLTFRYNNLSGPLEGRRDILEAWQVLFQFYRDLEEEVSWLSSRLLSIATKDLGSSLSSTQQLLHRHQVTPDWGKTGVEKGALFICRVLSGCRPGDPRPAHAGPGGSGGGA